MSEEHKIDAFKNIFGNIVSVIDTEDNLHEFAYNNFNGKFSMSYPNNAIHVVDYLKENYKNKNHIDIGASRGYLSKRLLEENINSYGIDGSDYGIKNNFLDIPMDRYAVCDMTKYDFRNTNLEKYFDISTAFEITEHIHEEDIEIFYNNVSFISKEHLCSIHVSGPDSKSGVRTSHHNIKNKNWWINFFKKYGKIEEMPMLKTKIGWEESEFLKIKFF